LVSDEKVNKKAIKNCHREFRILRLEKNGKNVRYYSKMTVKIQK